MSKLFLFIFSVSYLLTGCGSGGSDSDRSEKIVDFSTKEEGKITISEALCGNINVALDPDYNEFSDYIELHNNTSNSISLKNMFLSDDPDVLNKWRIPDNLTIKPNGYTIIWADKKDKMKKVAHTNFKLSQKKGTIIISDISGDVYDYINYSDVKSNVSIKRDGDKVLYMKPTPGTKNSQLYSNQDAIQAATLPKNDISSQPYFIDNKLPVVSISIDPTYLYDDYKGIYVVGKNGKLLKGCGKDDGVLKNYAQNWDRPAYFEFYDKSKRKIFSTGLNISISGECSRNQDKKSFAFKFSKKYGSKSIENYFYSKDIDKIKDFKLRSSIEGGYINDLIAATIVKKGNLDVDYQDYKAVEAFINGEYWGVYNIREKKSENFIKSNYPDVKRGKLDIIKNGNIVKNGDIKGYNELKNYLASKNFNLVDNNSYEYIKSVVDIDSFIDYMAVMIYSANDDWLAANHRCWRENKEGGKWRWMLDDLDLGFMDWNVNTNFFEIAKGNDVGGNDGLLMTELFRSLLTNTSFKVQFKNRFNQLLDTTLSKADMRAIVNELYDVRKDAYLRRHKWTNESNDVYEFASVIDRLNSFIDQRADIVRSELNRL
jgi:hypothetical protein